MGGGADVDPFLAEDAYGPYDDDYTDQRASAALVDSLERMAEDVAARVLADMSLRNGLAPLREAPEFLYRVEVGTATDDMNVFDLDDHEGETRLPSVVLRAQPVFYDAAFDFSGRNRISYSGMGEPIEAQDSPQTAFQSLFGSACSISSPPSAPCCSGAWAQRTRSAWSVTLTTSADSSGASAECRQRSAGSASCRQTRGPTPPWVATTPARAPTASAPTPATAMKRTCA